MWKAAIKNHLKRVTGLAFSSTSGAMVVENADLSFTITYENEFCVTWGGCSINVDRSDKVAALIEALVIDRKSTP